MNITDIRFRLVDIEREDDNEVAHKLEDDLLVDFIKHVAATANTRLAEMATEVLKVKGIQFTRWYA